MTHTLVIETDVDADYQLLLGLAHRLGLRVSEPDNQHETTNQYEQFARLFGSWQSDETGDQLTDQLRQARQDNTRPVDS